MKYPFAKQGIYNITPAIMTTKQLLLHELTMLQAHKDNLIKATELMSADWDKSITLSISEGIDNAIAGIFEITKQLK